MTRTLGTLVVLALFAQSGLAAQRREAPPQLQGDQPETGAGRGWAVGVTGFTGGLWQPSGVDVSLLRAVGSPARHDVAAFGVRVGAFVQDQAVLVGGSQGIYVTALLGLRRPLLNLAMVGTERNPSWVRLVAAPEVGLSVGANSPLPQGGWWGSGALLLGVSFGSDQRVEENFTILAGPALFAGEGGTDGHAQVTLRYQAPLARTRRPGGER